MRSVILSIVIGMAFVATGCGGGMSNAEKEELIEAVVARSDAAIATAVAQTEARTNTRISEAFESQDERMTEKILKQNEHLQSMTDELYARVNLNADEFQALVDSLRDRLNTNTADFQRFYDERVVELDEYYSKEYDRLITGVRSIYDETYEELRLSNEKTIEDAKQMSDDVTSLLNQDTEMILSLKDSICETDYWLTALWMATHQIASHIEGGDGSMEGARTYLEGLKLDADYGNYSGVCGVGDDDAWYLLNDGL